MQEGLNEAGNQPKSEQRKSNPKSILSGVMTDETNSIKNTLTVATDSGAEKPLLSKLSKGMKSIYQGVKLTRAINPCKDFRVTLVRSLRLGG